MQGARPGVEDGTVLNDESGYTGFDLLNSDQRFQGASAISISDEDASNLIKEYFPKLQAPELKYVSLARHKSNRDRLVRLQMDILSQNKCVTYICDKRYLLTLFFLDIAVEPFYYERGFDFYEDGQNYALASLLYTVGPTIFGKNEFQALMINFQRAVKEKTQSSIKALAQTVRELRWQELAEALGHFHMKRQSAWLRLQSLVLAPTRRLFVLQSLISRMEVMAKDTYRIEHDKSENLKQYHALLQQFIDHDQKIEFKQTEIASIKFPLKLSSVTQVDSKSSPCLELADILIGAAIEATNSMAGLRSSQTDPDEVLGLYADDQFIHMSPSLNFDEDKEFSHSTQAGELIEYFSQHLQIITMP